MNVDSMKSDWKQMVVPFGLSKASLLIAIAHMELLL